MNIAVIGAGKVGGALAKQFAKAGHQIYLGVRDTNDEKVRELISDKISAHSIPEAVSQAEVVLLAVPDGAAKEVAGQLGDVSNKIIIDAINTLRTDYSPFKTTAEAMSSWTNCKDIVKCFNTIGAHNMSDPSFGNERADMFVCGDSEKGKEVASGLAKDAGFGEVYDLGGSDKFEVIEGLAKAWIALSMNGYGRDFAFKIIKR